MDGQRRIRPPLLLLGLHIEVANRSSSAIQYVIFMIELRYLDTQSLNLHN